MTSLTASVLLALCVASPQPDDATPTPTTTTTTTTTTAPVDTKVARPDGPIDAAAKRVDDGDYEGAIAILEGSLPRLTLEQMIRRAEVLGNAHAFLDDADGALGAYRLLLELDPGHVLPYTLSPKATYLVEQARAERNKRRALKATLSAPDNVDAGSAIPFDVAVNSDSLGILAQVRVCQRVKGEKLETCDLVNAPHVGAHTTVILPALGEAGSFVSASLNAYDPFGNEIFRSTTPVEVGVSVGAVTPWYESPWLWTAAGTLATGGLCVAYGAYILSDQPVSYRIVEPSK